MTSTTPIAVFKRHDSPHVSEDEVWALFYFDLPSSLRLPAELRAACCSAAQCSPALPPSLSSRVSKPTGCAVAGSSITNNTSAYTYEIKYSVSATLWRQGIKVAYRTRKWNYIPLTVGTPPPLTVSHFPGEYRLLARSVAINPLRLKLYGRLVVHVDEPEPVLIEEGMAGTAKTIAVCPTLCLYPIFSFLDRTEEPDLRECECTISLQTDTFCSINFQGASFHKLTAFQHKECLKGRGGSRSDIKPLCHPGI